jgi:hypothetical protein
MVLDPLATASSHVVIHCAEALDWLERMNGRFRAGKLHGCAKSMDAVKRKKLDFGLDHTRIAGRERWFFRVMLAAMCQHLDAWSTHSADP